MLPAREARDPEERPDRAALDSASGGGSDTTSAAPMLVTLYLK